MALKVYGVWCKIKLMNRKITTKTKRIIAIYIGLLLLLYFIVFIVPKITDIFDTTQILENGNLEVSCEANGYLIKEEAVCIAAKTGDIKYKVNSGTVVKKGSEISKIKADDVDKDREVKSTFKDYLDRLKDYDLLVTTNEAPVSGIFSTTIDGYEKYFSVKNLDKITKEEAEKNLGKQLELERNSVRKGEPIYKISNDDYWYLLTWIDKEESKKFNEGEKVRIELPKSTVDAKVYSIKKEGDAYKAVFLLNAYYEDFVSERKVPMTIIQSDTVGLIVDNDCIIEKDGQKGVYVKTKDGDVYFRPIKIKITDGNQSVIYDSIYVNDKYEQVETVYAYQEVLRHPQEALEEEQKKETKAKEE